MKQIARRFARRFARWMVALAEPETPKGVPLPDGWPTEWPVQAQAHYWARGWGTYPVECLTCGHEYMAVAPVGTVCTTECPRCGAEWRQSWPGSVGEMPNDGVWL